MAGLTLFYLDYSLLSLSCFSSLISHFLALQPWHSASSFHTPVLQTDLSYICHKGPFTDLHLILSQIRKSPILFSSLDSITLTFHISYFHAAGFSAVLLYICHQSPFTALPHSSTILGLSTSHYDITNLTLH